MSLKGIWKNEYGSLMHLSQDENGMIHGSYQSTTGSTGSYYVLGAADPREPNAARGQAVSLSIFWRSIGNDPADPSWHWVSGLGGQLLGDGQNKRLILIHNMMATTEFPGQAHIGGHLDRLVYTPVASAEPVEHPSVRDLLEAAPKTGQASAIDGRWIDVTRPSISLSPSLLDGSFGIARAELGFEGKTCTAFGFMDPKAGAEDCRYHALSLSALLDKETGETITMAGSLDTATGIMSLTVFRNAGTSHEYRYTQTRVDEFRMKRFA